MTTKVTVSITEGVKVTKKVVQAQVRPLGTEPEDGTLSEELRLAAEQAEREAQIEVG